MRLKLNVLESAVRGKDVILVDDSIVRGTTIANLIRLLKQSGAGKVHVRISSPPFLHPVQPRFRPHFSMFPPGGSFSPPLIPGRTSAGSSAPTLLVI